MYDLGRQIGKYRSGLIKILEGSGNPHEPLELVYVLGKPPIEWNEPDGQNMVERMLNAVNARYVSYDQLLDNADQAYSDYQQRTKQTVEGLDRVIRAINDYAK